MKTDPLRIEAMMNEPLGNKYITRIPFYNMLANQTYRQMFEYIPIINDRKFQQINDIENKQNQNTTYEKENNMIQELNSRDDTLALVPE